MVLAATSERGCCPECGAGWVRLVEKDRVPTRPGQKSKVNVAREELKVNRTPGQGGVGRTSTLGNVVGNRDPERHVTSTRTIGWEPGCGCGRADTVPAIVLDPFGGAGTVGVVAKDLKRRVILCELNPEYAAMARDRIDKVDLGLFADT
jgi:hypothetical protein